MCSALCQGLKNSWGSFLEEVSIWLSEKENLENYRKQFILRCGGSDHLVYQSGTIKKESDRFHSLLEVLYKGNCLKSQISLHWDLFKQNEIITCLVSLGLIKLNNPSFLYSSISYSSQRENLIGLSRVTWHQQKRGYWTEIGWNHLSSTVIS